MKRQRVGIVFLLIGAWVGLWGCGQELLKETKYYKQNIEQAIWSKDGKQVVFLYSNLENSQTQAETKYIYLLDITTRQLKELKHFNGQRPGSDDLDLLDWAENDKFLISMNQPSVPIKMYSLDKNGTISDNFGIFTTTVSSDGNFASYLFDLSSILYLNRYPWYGNAGKTENSVIQLYNVAEKKFSDLTLDFPAEIERPILIDSMSVFSTAQKTRVSISVEGTKPKDKLDRIVYQVYFDLVNQKASNLQVYKKYTITNAQRIVFSFMGWKSVDEVVYALDSENKPLYFDHNLVTNTVQSRNFPVTGQLNPEQSKLMTFKGVGGLLVIDVKNPINQVLIDYDQLPRGDFLIAT